jgi:hypothetical protein
MRGDTHTNNRRKSDVCELCGAFYINNNAQSCSYFTVLLRKHPESAQNSPEARFCVTRSNTVMHRVARMILHGVLLKRTESAQNSPDTFSTCNVL